MHYLTYKFYIIFLSNNYITFSPSFCRFATSMDENEIHS